MKALLIRAAELLEGEADCLLQSHTVVDDDQRSNGGPIWDDSDEPTREAHESYDEMVKVAGELRQVEFLRLEAGATRANREDVVAGLLIQAIESSGFSVPGPTDYRAAEHGEPHWVCNVRAMLADRLANSKADDGEVDIDQMIAALRSAETYIENLSEEDGPDDREHVLEIINDALVGVTVKPDAS